MLFKSGKSWPDSAEDRGYQLSRPASSVSHCMLAIHMFYSHILRNMLNVFSTTLLGLDEEGGQIYCPAPLPEEPASPLLKKMLVPAPYKAPKKKAEMEAKKTRGSLRRCGASDTKSEDSNARSSSEEDEEEEEDESLAGGRKKRMASTSLEAESPKRGKTPHPEESTAAADSSPEWDPRAQPLVNS